MFFNSFIFYKLVKCLLIYTSFIATVPESFSIRIGISYKNYTFINQNHWHKILDNGAQWYDNKLRKGFPLQNSRVDKILEDLKGLTLLETSELIKKMEEVFGVSATPLPQGPLTLRPQAITPEEPYKEEEEDDEQERERDKRRKHNVVIKEIAKEKRIDAFKTLKEYFPDRSASEIKKIMDSLPYTVKTVTSQREAEEIIKKLTTEGMKIEIE